MRITMLALIIAPAFVLAACRRGSSAPPPAPAPLARPVPAPSRRAEPAGVRPKYVGTLDATITQADLDSLWAHQLMVPVEGVSRRTLRDGFTAHRGGRIHAAMDIPSPRLTAVLATDDLVIGRLVTGPVGGVVIYATDLSGQFVYYFAHLDRYRRGLAVGDRVAKASVIGYVGTTGNASPAMPHLHFQVMKRGAGRVWWDGPPINSIAFFAFDGVRP